MSPRGTAVALAVLAESLRDQHWMDHALCVEMDLPVDFFFVEKGDAGPAQRAKAVCRTCPVAEQCGRWARTANAHFGIFGGEAPKDRRESSAHLEML